jgi:hypothetical protein
VEYHSESTTSGLKRSPKDDRELIHHYFPTVATGLPAIGEVPDIQEKDFQDSLIVREHFFRICECKLSIALIV